MIRYIIYYIIYITCTYYYTLRLVLVLLASQFNNAVIEDRLKLHENLSLWHSCTLSYDDINERTDSGSPCRAMASAASIIAASFALVVDSLHC